MEGWIVAGVIAAVALMYFFYQKRKQGNDVLHTTVTRNRTTLENNENARQRVARPVPAPERNETGSMVYFANDRHGQSDKEYRFNYKKINGSWRAYILRMPDLRGRNPNSIPTHRLWDDNHNPYICWKGTVTSLKDMQNISRVWADSIQEYIATGQRFGEEQNM